MIAFDQMKFGIWKPDQEIIEIVPLTIPSKMKEVPQKINLFWLILVK